MILDAVQAADIRRIITEGLRIAAASGNDPDAIDIQVPVDIAEGDNSGAFAEFLVASEENGDSGGDRLKAQCLTGLGMAYFFRGEHRRSRECLQRAVPLQREIGNSKGLVLDLDFLARCEIALGNYDVAAACLRESLATARRLPDRTVETRILARISRLETQWKRSNQGAVDPGAVHNVIEAGRDSSNQHRPSDHEFPPSHPDVARPQAIEDSLTGIYNRRYVDDYLCMEVERVRRRRIPLAVLIVDIDNFTEINDCFTRRTGDAVLRAVAELIVPSMRRNDIAARYGGDEFVVVLPGADHIEAVATSERVRSAIEQYPWGYLHPELHVTISVGIADDKARSSEDLLALADQRLMQAKRQKNNRLA